MIINTERKKCFRVLNTTLIILMVLASLSIVLSEHEPNHRYTIRGVVQDSAGNPLSNVEVTASDTKIGLTERVITNQKGEYSIQLHVHNENLGDPLTVSANGIHYEGKILFEAGDVSTERIFALNLKGDTWTEGELTKSTGIDLTTIGIVAVLLILLYLGVRSSKKGGDKSPTRKKRRKKGKK
jgi:hypothetical protein